MKILNLAHGEFFMIGGFVLYFAMTSFGIPPILGLVLAVVIVFFLGVLVEKTIMGPLMNRPGWIDNTITASVGIGIFFQNFALKMWGERFRNLPYFFDGILEVFGFRIAYQRAFIIGATTVVMLAFWVFIKKAKLGLGLRATAQDRDAATLVGINAKIIYTITFGMSCAMASFAAALLLPIYSVNPWVGHALLMKGLVTCVLGGLGSFEGAILAGMLLGNAESIAVIIFSSEWKDVVSFAIFMLVLIMRPSGLFGAKEW
jgi:branched-chain amino acid transport system permease protein